MALSEYAKLEAAVSAIVFQQSKINKATQGTFILKFPVRPAHLANYIFHCLKTIYSLCFQYLQSINRTILNKDGQDFKVSQALVACGAASGG